MKFILRSQYGEEVSLELLTLSGRDISANIEPDDSLTVFNNHLTNIAQVTLGEDWKWKAGE